MTSTTRDTASNGNLSHWVVGAMTFIYFVTSLLLFYLLCIVWPADHDTGKNVGLVGWSIDVRPEVRLIWMVLLASSLGSYIHTVTSFTLYAGNRSLARSWLAWYFLRPAISGALALIFYFMLRAGLFSGAAADQTVSPFGIAAISGMVGMFSKQATEKMGKIFDTIFS